MSSPTDTIMAPDGTVLDRLFATIESRAGGDPEASYTAKLLSAGVTKVAQKVGEEAVETVIAATSEGAANVAAESADLLYHLLVLWQVSGVQPADVWQVLSERDSVSGLAEKAARRD